MSEEPKPADRQLELASELGSEIGRDAGAPLLRTARAAILANASRPGSSTSEFKLSVVLVLVGGAMVITGAYLGDTTLQAQGSELVKWVGLGYAASRGLAKAGAGMGTKDKA